MDLQGEVMADGCKDVQSYVFLQFISLKRTTATIYYDLNSEIDALETKCRSIQQYNSAKEGFYLLIYTNSFDYCFSYVSGFFGPPQLFLVILIRIQCHYAFVLYFAATGQ